jgi:hypothetical protein
VQLNRIVQFFENAFRWGKGEDGSLQDHKVPKLRYHCCLARSLRQQKMFVPI